MAESATRTESVRMYVISPTGPSSPISMPSYSCWAIRIVTAAEKPSCFAASCCSVLVRNGGGAGRRRSPFSTAVTLKGILSASATIARGALAVFLLVPAFDFLAQFPYFKDIRAPYSFYDGPSAFWCAILLGFF